VAKATSRPWDARKIRALRAHLRLSQAGLAQELGTRQQTVSEWETGQYRPRGASARLLTIVAERAGFAYVSGRPPVVEGQSETSTGQAETGETR